MGRTAKAARATRETEISVELNIDGTGSYDISTGIGFFDHMLRGFARHGFFDISLKAKGDLEVDGHHTVEDCGIVLGRAFKEAAGSKEGIKRFGSSMIPMDDALVMAAADLSGRHYLSFDLPLDTDFIGSFDTQLVREFFYAFSSNAEINLHIKKISGTNSHHIVEAAFKAAAKALCEAFENDPRVKGALSTKGTL